MRSDSPTLCAKIAVSLDKCVRSFWRLVAKCLPHTWEIRRIIFWRGSKFRVDPDAWEHLFHRAIAVLDGIAPDTDTLFLGSSHILYGVCPNALRTLHGWNAAFVAGDLRMAYYTYVHIAKTWRKGEHQRVVLGDDFWMHAHKSEYTQDYFHNIPLHLITGMPFRRAFLIGKHLRTARAVYRQMLRNKEAHLSSPKRGFIALSAVLKTPSEEALQKLVRRQRKSLTFVPTERVWFDKLRAAVETDGRQLVLLRPPHRDDYRAAFGDIDPWVQGGSAPTVTDLPILNFYAFPLPDDAWNDLDHLNVSGAETFTRALEDALLKR